MVKGISLFFVLLFVIVVSLGFVSATGQYLVNVSTGGNSFSVNQTISNNYNITINNTYVGQNENITQVNVSLFSGATLNVGSNGTGTGSNGTVSKSLFSNSSLNSFISWTNSTDGFYLLNGTESRNFWFNLTAVNPGNYNFSVTTVNGRGEFSINYLYIQVNDTIAPAVTLVSPIVAGNYSTYTSLLLNASVIDNVGVNTVYFNITNGSGQVAVLNAVQDGSSIFWENNSFNVYYYPLPVGYYNVTIYANDSVGNMNSSVKRQFLIDNNAPTLSAFNLDQGGNYSGSILLNATVVDPLLGVSQVYFVVHGSGHVNTSSATNIVGTNFWNATLNTSALLDGDGSYVIGIVYNNSLGLASETDYSIQVDNTAPILIIGSPIAYANLSSKIISINLTVSDSLSGLNYTNISVYNSTGVLINSTTNSTAGNSISSLSVSLDGVYTINVTSYDNAGNINATSLNVTVDTTNPSLKINSPVNGINSTSRTLNLNISTNDTNFAYVNVSVYFSSCGSYGCNFYGAYNLINSNSSPVALNNQNLSVNVSQDGSYMVNVTAYDTLGHKNESSFLWNSVRNPPYLFIMSPSNLSKYYVNETVPVRTVFWIPYISLACYWWGNETWNSTCLNLEYYGGNGTIPLSLNFTTNKTYSIYLYANDSLGNLNIQPISVNVINLPSNVVIANSSNSTISTNVSQVIIPYNTTITLPPVNVSNQSINIDLSRLYDTNQSSINVTVVVVNSTLNLIRENSSSNQNISVIIANNTLITGNSSWDLNLTWPILNVNYSNFTAPVISGNTTSVSLVIETGNSVPLNLSNAAEIFLPNMSGMMAGWTDNGNLTLTDISTVCISDTNYSNINSTGPRECYNNDSNGNLIIWTYHFTTFAAYSAVPYYCGDGVCNNGESCSSCSSDCGSCGGSSTGGGGGYAAPSYWTNTYVLTDSQIALGYTKELGVKERVQFNLNKTLHSVGVVGLTTTTATINVSSDSQSAVFSIGDEKKFDVNGDNYYDLSVKLNSITNSKASLTFKPINEAVVAAPAASPEANKNPVEVVKDKINEIGTNIAQKAADLSWLWWVIVIILVVLLIIIVYKLRVIRRHRKSYGFKLKKNYG